MKSLAEISKKYPDSDKRELGYFTYYEKHLPKRITRFLEVGVWKGDGIRAFRDYYKNKGEFHCANYVFGGEVIPAKETFEKEGFICHIADDASIESLSAIKEKFDVIVEDASHHSDSQIICFKQLFLNNLISGGWYALEDLHCCRQNFFWRSIEKFEDTILAIFQRVIDGGDFASQLISENESSILKNNIAEIHLYESIAFIKRK